MEEEHPDIYTAMVFVTILCVTVILFLFIWKSEAHPDSRFKFRTLGHQIWKVIFLLGLLTTLLLLVLYFFQ